MNIAILGIGSIGAYIAAMFAQNTDHHLYLLARSNYAAIQEQGIVVEEASGCDRVKAHRFTVVDDIHKIPSCDVVVLAVKESQLAALLPGLESICHVHTKIICLQNGINFENSILKAVPEQPLYSGTCWIKVATLAPGHIRHDFGQTIKLGKYRSKDVIVPICPSDRVIEQLFDDAKLHCELVENIQAVQLTKLALNVPFMLLMALEGKTPSEILADRSMNAKREELQREITEAGLVYGTPVDGEFLEKTLDSLRRLPVVAAPSPGQLAESMQSELPGNAGALLDLMESKGIQLPELRKLYENFYCD